MSRTFAQESPQKIEPIAVVSIAGTDELLADVLYLTEAAGSGDVGRLAALMASPYTAALDKQKPSGVYVVMTGEEEVGAVGFIPVKDLELLLAALKQQIGEPEDVGDGVLEIGTDRPQSVFVKQQKAWAFITNERELLDDLPKNPAKLLGGCTKSTRSHYRRTSETFPMICVSWLLKNSVKASRSAWKMKSMTRKLRK